MSLFPSTLTGRILDDGVTEPPVIELQGISAGQLATVLTAYTPLETSTQHTADIGTNAAAIAALQGQVSALPAAPDLTPYALAADLSAAEGLIAANASGLTAVNTWAWPVRPTSPPWTPCRSRSTASPRRPPWTSSWRTTRR